MTTLPKTAQGHVAIAIFVDRLSSLFPSYMPRCQSRLSKSLPPSVTTSSAFTACHYLPFLTRIHASLRAFTTSSSTLLVLIHNWVHTLLHGIRPTPSHSLTNEITTVTSDNTPLSVTGFIKNWHMDLATARASIGTAQQRQQLYANQHRHDVSYEPGQLIYISTSGIKIRTLAAKLKQRWISPYPVTHRTGAVT